MKLLKLRNAILSLAIIAISGSAFAQGSKTQATVSAAAKSKSYSQVGASKAPGDTIFFEDFNSGMPSNFTLLNFDSLNPNGTYANLFGDTAWVVVNWNGTPDPVATSVSWYNPVGQSNDWMIVPITLPDVPALFKWEAAASDGVPFNDGYDVYVSTSADTTSLVANGPVFSTPGESPSGNFVTRTINFAALGLQDTTVFVAFRNRTFNGNLLWIDNILVTELAPTAEVQIVHNSADLAAGLVDIYLNDALALDSVAFQTATPFLTLPDSFNLKITPAGAGIGSAVYDQNVEIVAGERYVAIAGGIVSGSGYNPSPAFDIFATSGRNSASVAGNTDVLVFHGSTDAPTVTVNETSLGINLIDTVSFGNFNDGGYLELPNADYTLEVTDSAGISLYYNAPLQTLGLADSALVVVASGFVDPSQNSNGAAFGLYAILPSGGAFIQLPQLTTAKVQVIHNSADLAADSVDVFIDGALALGNVKFRTATGFIDLPQNFTLDIAPAGAGIGSSVFNGNFTLVPGETYVAIASGIVSGSGYNPAPAFDIFPTAGREVSTTPGNTDVLIFHGSTDAPTVSVNEITVPVILENGFSFGEYNDGGYLDLPNADFTLEVTDSAGVQLYYAAPLQTLGLADSALVVLASGFVDPSQNSNGAGFGLFAVLPSGGAFIPLPALEAPKVQIIHNSADLAADTVDVFVNGAAALPGVAFRNATGFLSLSHEFDLDIAPAGAGLGGSVFNAPISLMPGEKYIVVANGILSGSGYNPAPAFGLDVFAGAREAAATAGNTDVLVYHGSTDAPTVDINETSVPAGTLVSGISYSEFDTAYLELGNADYVIEVTDNGAISLEYQAPLSTLGLADSALVVLASGFVDPAQNSNGEGFGLFVALPSGGELIALPLVVGLENEAFNAQFNIYPNPANNALTVDFGEVNVQNVRIVNILGQEVKSFELNGVSIETFDVSDIKGGTYFIQIEGDNQIGSIPVVIQ